MNNDDRVPKITPITITKEKPNKVDPPRNNRGTSTSKVVPDVMRVLLKVTFKE
jgi:hypothetical protein